MKYKVGDKLIYNDCGNYVDCTIVKLLENTNRYRINYIPLWDNGKTREELVDERKLFVNLVDAIDSEIRDIKRQIEHIQSKLALLNQKKREKTMVMNP